MAAEVEQSADQSSRKQAFMLWYRNYDNPAIRSLVGLALAKTSEYGDYRLVRSRELTQGRALYELANDKSGLIDIINVATSPAREQRLNAIPVPIDGGLLGFRVCVTVPEKLPLFEGVRTLDDLVERGISIGQGSHWPDTPILKANGVSVVTHSHYEILFGMLRNNRFDCFARGVSEVLHDLEVEGDPGLVIEPNLVIAYPMPSYLFVGPEKDLLAYRLQLGLERAIEDGTFAEYLRHYFSRPVMSLNLEDRHIIRLENPYLTEESRHLGRNTLRNLQQRVKLFAD
ncbi:ABC transporter substrate-binding protein [Marinobacter pelagius]|uniref:ABC transporter substrate-binding protein n=1 Tax=Marinobacter sp. C7 TaxID=2951363 RepID=UPI001EF0FEC6|nr:ABC transporter substrate-binding protein [Marinobacter sp. C7]